MIAALYDPVSPREGKGLNFARDGSRMDFMAITKQTTHRPATIAANHSSMRPRLPRRGEGFSCWTSETIQPPNAPKPVQTPALTAENWARVI